MKIKINTNINSELEKDEIEITINTSRNSDTLNKIIENIQCISENIDTIIGAKENNISIYVSKRRISNVMKFLRERGN